MRWMFSEWGTGRRRLRESIPPRTRRGALRWLGLAILAATAAARAAPPEADASGDGYVLGSGFAIPHTDWHIGGYATASVSDPEHDPVRLALDNLSMFLWWQGEGRWKFFSEFEYQNALSNRNDNRFENDYFSWERAYLEYALSDDISVRAGKFLTPIGHWNLVHATPLVWTTSRPLTTTLAFPTNMTGVMVSANVAPVGHGLDLSFYGANGEEIRPNPEIDPFSSALGAHATLSLGGESQIGFSYADFEQEKSRPERKQLVGVDFLWTHARFELSGEAVYRASDMGGAADERGAFLQLVVPVTERLYAVGRYENYRLSNQPGATELWVGGLNFRIRPTIVLKAEWVDARHNTVDTPDGLLASLSVLL
jgi:hypothetical protein